MESQGGTAVAVDRDKNSQYAVKWAIDHLLIGNTNQTILLLHVRNKSNSSLQIQTKEILLEEVDVAKAISDYVAFHNIHNLVVGAASRNLITRKFKPPDVASILSKTAPEFCAVYVITKGKAINIRSAKGPAPAISNALPPFIPHHQQQQQQQQHLSDFEIEDSTKKAFKKGNVRGFSPAASPPPAYLEKALAPRTQPMAKAQATSNNASVDHSVYRPGSRAASRESFPLENELLLEIQCHKEGPDISEESFSRSSFSGGMHRDWETEMKRLRLELKQTMDMYSTACKEAICAKQKAKELHEWKMVETKKFEEVRQAEEAAMAMAEMEKVRCKAAMEAAEAAQKLAEMEAKRRLDAERKAAKEAEEKKKALDALAHNDVRYRKYDIDEIEVATGYFSKSQLIGEGGYGPVYKASLNHTPVAIKVLRPDAQQGRKQFQQEVEVLSCIRHPNMVLLLGACPEYGCLVYEYMDNGSLEDRIFRRGDTAPIPWPVRFKIAAEVATALLFLHQTKPEPLVHRDLKPANILLDRNYVSKISDVGLARLVPPSVADSVTQYRMTSTAGTFCYIDPEYQQTGMLGTKSDIYSLGVMLLQIITAKPPMGLTHIVERALNKGTFQELLDPTLTDCPLEDLESFARLALKCSELRKKDRPDLATVILPELNRLRNLGHEYEANAWRSG
ncbi:hypothetical protein J5N97_003872 [Dioscorea zingiberensis]|uniref:RING-type E3 ubiquitin transferase n=1 Tax=Dioscorea zingiberensis TaxID=325984 RepID=A0A9D5HR35_9LILI|nr:hypothetical protein J5N97_003872 [Dioscorea zingiberensis]